MEISESKSNRFKGLRAAAVLMLAVLCMCTPAFAAKKYTIKNVKADYAIQADVTLSGSGTGYHAKLIACTPTAATSFGIQFDTATWQEYASIPAFMIENVMSNNAGGQAYHWVGKGEPGRKYRLMLAFKKKSGKVSVYIDGRKVKTVRNPSLKGKQVSLRVEASARKGKDKVDAVFSNIKIKKNGKYKKSYKWKTVVFDTNRGIKSDVSEYSASKTIRIAGKIKGLSKSQDWDSAYGSVSGIVQFR